MGHLARLALAVTLVSAAQPAWSGPRAEAILHLVAGDEQLAADDLENALAHYETAVQLDDNLAEAHRGRGLTLARLGQIDDAIGALETAVSLHPDNATLHLDLSLLYLARGDLFWASDEIVAAAEQAPDDPLIGFWEGRILFELGELRAAEAAFDRAASSPDLADRAGFYQGLIELRLGEEAGRDTLADVAEMSVDSPYTHAAAQLTDQLLRAGWDVPPTWSGFVSVGSAYDTNVILEPDDVAQPLGAEAVGISVRGGVTAAPLASSAHLLTGFLTAERTTYLAQPPDQFSSTSAAISASYRYRFPVAAMAHSIALSAAYNVMFFDGGNLADEPDFHAFTESVAASVRYDIDEGERYRTFVEARYRYAVYSDMRRDGDSVTARLGETLLFSGGRLKLLMALAFRYDDAAGRGYDLWGGQATLGLSGRTIWALEPRAILTAVHNNHFDSGYYAGWGPGRQDDVLMSDLGVTRSVWGPLLLDLYWTHTAHASTAPRFDYSRNAAGLTLTARWP